MSTVQQRLADTAADLFYRHGITSTGVDRIVAESGVSKPTLYAHFRSKNALVAAALRTQHDRRRSEVEEYLTTHDAPDGRWPLLVFDWLELWHATQDGRGCAFVNASAELTGPESAEARDCAAAHKRWWRGLLTELCARAGADRPGELADAMCLLLDGAHARLLVENDPRAASAARRAAATLLAAHLETR